MRDTELVCDACNKTFVRSGADIAARKGSKKFKNYWKNYCSKSCHYKGTMRRITLLCVLCGKSVERSPSAISKNTFCSQSCAAIYNNTHKTHGTRRSKLEIYLEQKLKEKYQNLPMDFNEKDAIHSELDIYIPSLKLAFELNGIFHYEPIYGKEKLASIQNNDKRKFQACLERGIELCIIDSSKLRYFKEERGRDFLDIIVKIIDNKLNNCPDTI